LPDDPEENEPSSSPEGAPLRDPDGFRALLEYLHRARGFDFTGYKEASLARRVDRRMQMVNIRSFAEYTDYLEVHPDEFPQLFNMVLINVTAFFRDTAAWTALAAQLPKLFGQRPDDRPIRVWSAGCASGEEAFTLAMLFAEYLGLEACTRRVKIYATDVDDDALTQARQATYTAKAVESIPPELLEKYFTPSGSGYTFNKDLRRAVIFGRHDLVQDAPISRIDVLTCRNTLMYFNAETQTKILNRLHFALAPDGILFLGKAEMLLTHGNLFVPVDLKLRIFGRASRGAKGRERPAIDLSLISGNGNGNGHGAADAEAARGRVRLQQSIFENSPNALVVIDAHGRLALANNHAHHAFGLTARDVGKPFQDLELSYRPVELRSYVDVVRVDKRPKHIREVERSVGGNISYYDITVTPLFSEHLAVVAVQVEFADVTTHHRLQAELRKVNADLEAAHETLQSTSEELETTNEELQSTVEELETTNEELQSTNEELETMNEELQSTNEELQTMNDELRTRGADLNRVSSFFGAVLRTLHSGVVVLDDELKVQAWNERMEELWGVSSEEVKGKHLLNLDIGLPVAELAASIRACVQGAEEVDKTLDCTNRRGKPVTCKVFITRLSTDGNRGVIILVEEQTPT
jgi:two-component system, chemotaxis family, CheB/CheR fusion protein